MKHIEHATESELNLVELCDLMLGAAKEDAMRAAAQKRAIAERCRARARRHKEGKP